MNWMLSFKGAGWRRLGGLGGLLAASVDGVLLAASVGRTLSPPACVVVLLMSDFLAYYY
jgi:hypothetical protein